MDGRPSWSRLNSVKGTMIVFFQQLRKLTCQKGFVSDLHQFMHNVKSHI